MLPSDEVLGGSLASAVEPFPVMYEIGCRNSGPPRIVLAGHHPTAGYCAGRVLGETLERHHAT